MNKKHSTLKYTLISLFLIACLSIPAMATTASPEYPMTLSGGVIINGADAPAGTIIEAKEGDNLLGTTTVQVDGKYGNTALNKLPVTKPDGASVDLYIQLPSMSSSVKVASAIWESNDKTFNIDTTIDTNTGSGDNTNNDNGGGGGMGSAATETETPGGASTNTKEDTNTGEQTATQSLKDGIEDTVFQTRDAAKDNTILSSVLLIGFIALALLGYMKYKET
ncbi:MAG: hypothetical protein KAH86_00215 [Methanosarcinales archaeon]|nr:hypothetical protein [Methanosarcinales archaeon]